MKKLKTFIEHQADAFVERQEPPSQFRYSGVACPDCGLELYGDPNDCRASNPPCGQVCCANGHYTFLTHPISWGEYVVSGEV